VLSTLSLPVILADADEAAAHEARLDAIDKAARGVSLWRQAGAAAGEGTASAGTSAATST